MRRQFNSIGKIFHLQWGLRMVCSDSWNMWLTQTHINVRQARSLLKFVSGYQDIYLEEILDPTRKGMFYMLRLLQYCRSSQSLPLLDRRLDHHLPCTSVQKHSLPLLTVQFLPLIYRRSLWYLRGLSTVHSSFGVFAAQFYAQYHIQCCRCRANIPPGPFLLEKSTELGQVFWAELICRDLPGFSAIEISVIFWET